jgi:uncharacterized protein (DUF58 family)
MQQRYLDPAVLAAISGLDLVAKTVVDGFVSGLHRSPDFGFSQEFAEYRMYNPGDDLRHVDWNVFARTERCYLKRYRGETNTLLTVMLDASASMAFQSNGVTKLSYAKYLAASLIYLANHQQRDAAGVIIFDDEVRHYVKPSARQGQLHRVLHAVNHAETGKRTDYEKPYFHVQSFLQRRGIVVLISDFFQDPERIVKTIAPLRWRGNELVLFHVLDPREIRPVLPGPALLVDMETGETLEVTPDYAKREYPEKIDAHIEAMKSAAKGAGMDYMLLPTDRPLDAALREYLTVRVGRN